MTLYINHYIWFLYVYVEINLDYCVRFGIPKMEYFNLIYIYLILRVCNCFIIYKIFYIYKADIWVLGLPFLFLSGGTHVNSYLDRTFVLIYCMWPHHFKYFVSVCSILICMKIYVLFLNITFLTFSFLEIPKISKINCYKLNFTFKYIQNLQTSEP